jgi:hypothetical protein
MKYALELTETELQMVHEILQSWFVINPDAGEYLKRKGLTPRTFDQFIEKVNDCPAS